MWKWATHRSSRKVTQQEESQAAVLLSDQLGDGFKREKIPARCQMLQRGWLS